MAFFRLNPTLRSVSLSLADYGVDVGDTVFLRLDGAFQAASSVGDTSRNSWIDLGDGVPASIDSASGSSLASIVVRFAGHDAATIVGGNLVVTDDPGTVAVVTPTIAMTASSDTGRSSTDGVTSNARPTFTGTAQANAVVAILDGGSIVAQATADAAGLWTVTPSAPLAEGVHSLVVEAPWSAVGPRGISAPLAVTIDTTAPTAPAAPALAAGNDSGVLSSDNVTGFAAPVFTGTGEVGAQIDLYDGATVVGTGTVGTDGTWSVRAAALADGEHAITARLTDLAGNVSAASAPVLVTIDTTAPATPGTPGLARASDTGASRTDNITSSATPVFTGIGQAGTVVDLYDGSRRIGSGIVGSDGTWSIKSRTLADGPHQITAQLTDTAGNRSGASAALAVSIDATPPTAPSVPDLVSASDSGRSNTDNVTAVTAPLYIGRGEAGAKVDLYDGTTWIGSATVDALGNWSVTSMVLAEGVHAITARLTDAAGNTGPASAALTVTIDTTAPDAPTVPDLATASDSGRSGIDNITSVTTPVFIGRGEAGAKVDLYEGSTWIGSGIVGALGNWAVTSKALAAGVHAITARLTDAAGNISAPSAALWVTIDTTPPGSPTVPDLAAASDSGMSSVDNITSSTRLQFIGRGEAGAKVNLYDGTTLVGSGIVGALGNWAVTTTTLAAGTHAISAQLADVAGNLGAPSAALAVTIDTTAPSAPSTPDMTAATDNGGSSTDNRTSIAAPRFTGTGEAGAQVRLFDGTTQIGIGTVNAANTWTVTVSPLSLGDHQITARIVDVAGNVSSASSALAVTITATSPAAASMTAPLAATAPFTPVHLVLSDLRFLNAVGTDGDDTLAAGGLDQTLTGGAGHDVLTGYAGCATTFRDSAAGLDGDVIRAFGGDDAIVVTDLLPSATIRFDGDASGGTLTLTDGIRTARIGLEGDYTAAVFHLGADSPASSRITLIG